MPARLLVKEETGVTEQHHDLLSELRDEHPCWLDIANPKGEDFALAARELNLHPLAVEYAQHQHKRPKIDEYDDHYYIVVYAHDDLSPNEILHGELSLL